MAAFTSIASGNWNDGPTTWGTGAGVYPGSTDSQADTAVIAATHNVTLNITAPAAGATVTTVTVNEGSGGGAAGTLTVSAVMSSAWIGAVTTNYTADQERGHLVFLANTAATLYLSDALTMNGDWQMVATGASAKHILYYGNQSTVGANATINLVGRTKTVAAQFAGAPDGIHTWVDDGAGGDVTGWEVGDYLAGQKSTATRDYKIITADDGFAYGKHQYDCSLSSGLQDNGRCTNPTRSCVLIGTCYYNQLTINDGAMITALKYVEFQQAIFANKIVAPLTITGCSWYLTTDAQLYNINAGNLTMTDCVGYATNRGLCLCAADITASIATLIRCVLFSNATKSAIFYASTEGARGKAILQNCESSGAYLTTCSPNACNPWTYVNIYAENCYAWGTCAAGMHQGSGIAFLTNCVFGKDIGGNANDNTLDVSTGAASYIFLEDCLLNSITQVTVGIPDAHIVSVSNGQVDAARKEWQAYGTDTKGADADFNSGLCDTVDPSSAIIPYQKSIWFPCASGKTPTLTINQKGTGTLGTCTVALGYSRCGLTGIATGGTITPDYDGGVSLHAITFTGTTDLSGDIEVIISVLDGDGGDMFSIGDLVASNNL